MAHRGPLREIFGLICMAIIFPKSERKTTPVSNTTGYIIDHDDGDIHITHPILTPQTSPFILTFLTGLLFDIGEVLVNMTFEWVLDNGIPPTLTVIGRAFSQATTFAARLLRASNPRRRAVVGEATERMPQAEPEAEGPGGEDQGSNAEGLHPAPEESPNDTATIESNEQALVDLRVESAEKDAQIAILIKSAKVNSDKFASISQENAEFTRDLRLALDPYHRSSPTADFILLANSLNQQLRSRTRALEKRSENVRNWEREKEQKKPRSADARDEEVKEAAAKLEKAENKAEAEAARAAELEGNLEEARNAAQELQNAAERAEVAEKKVKEEAARVTELTQNLSTAQSEAEALRNTARSVAAAEKKKAEEEGTRVAELTQNLSTAQSDAEALRDTAGRVAAAERKAEEKATRMSELVQNLSEAREAADEERRSNDRLIAKLEKTEEELKKKKGEVTHVRRLETELEKAREKAEGAFDNGFAAAITQTSQASPDDQNEVVADPGQQHGWEEGYQKAVSDCEVQGRHLINEAVEKERSEAAERQRVAINQREQELQVLFQQKWTEQMTQLTTTSNTQVQHADPEMVRDLQSQLQTAVQRAIKAEQMLNSPENPIQEARNWANYFKAQYEEQLLRAQAAEQQVKDAEAQARSLKEEVEKYQKGKLSQDGRLADAQRELSEANKHRSSDLSIAELMAAGHERERAWALMEESIRRHYESPTREVVGELLNANSCIKALEIKLQISTTKSSQTDFLRDLRDADIDKAKLKNLEEGMRQVLVRQCAAVNAKLMALRTLIKADKQPNKEKLLLEIFKPRGDEEAQWNDEKTELDAESVESDADEDEDEDGGSGRASSPSLPADPRPENHLKRKGSDDIEASRFGMPYDPLNMGMRPVESRAFSFNAPSNIASGILPHVRRYTHLSGKTNMVLSRRQSDPSRAEP